MFSVSQVGKNAYRVGKTKGLLRVDASEVNTRHVMAHCGGRGAQWLTMGPILAQEASTHNRAPVMPALYAFVPA